MDKVIGTRLDGRYLIEELVGEGGMADVYRGQDLAVNRTVAVKILKAEYRDNEELVRRFMNESRAISVLNHPGIVKVYDVSVTDKVYYIAMEFINGITLKEYIEQRGEPLTYKEVVHFIQQVLRVLQHAHDKGIVHRDIKPQNIMILEDGSIKVMDFGIARLARSEIHTAEEQAIGSVHYISPEQAQGADTDHRADIYSVGIMMYEMLTGTLPFEDENAVSIAIKHISDQARPLLQVNPSVPQGLADITGKAMSKAPKDRYQSALEMLRDIEEFKENPSIKFEYDYAVGTPAAGYVDKVMSGGAPPQAGRARGGKNGKPKKVKKYRRKHIGLLVPISLGLALAVLGACLYYSYDLLQNSQNPLFVDIDDVPLPDFQGMAYSEVTDMLSRDPYRLLRLEVQEVFSLEDPAGTVISQNPKSDNNNQLTVKANQQVRLVVSIGIEEVTIPDFTMYTRHEAEDWVLDHGLTPYVRDVENSTVAPGQVIGSDPEFGMLVRSQPGTVITIYVSGKARNYAVIVPTVVNLENVEAAQRTLDTVNLIVGKITKIHSAEPEGTVLQQTPEAGTVATIGDLVYITVSMGPEPPPPPEEETIVLPDLATTNLDAANTLLGAIGLVFNPSGAYSDTVPKGLVIYTDPAAGSEVKEGDTITVVYSLGPDPATQPPPPPSTPSETNSPSESNTSGDNTSDG